MAASAEGLFSFQKWEVLLGDFIPFLILITHATRAGCRVQRILLLTIISAGQLDDGCALKECHLFDLDGT